MRLNLVPEPHYIRVLAGASLRVNVRVRYDTGADVDLTSATFESDIFAREGAAPAVTSFTTELAGDRIAVSLTAAETELIPGKWGISLWAVIGDTRIPCLRGDLEVIEP